MSISDNQIDVKCNEHIQWMDDCMTGVHTISATDSSDAHYYTTNISTRLQLIPLHLTQQWLNLVVKWHADCIDTTIMWHYSRQSVSPSIHVLQWELSSKCNWNSQKICVSKASNAFESTVVWSESACAALHSFYGTIEPYVHYIHYRLTIACHTIM